MAVTLTGSAEALFTRLGTIISEYNRVASAFGTTLNTKVNAIASGYRENDQIVIDTLYSARDSYRNVHSTYLNDLASRAGTTVVEQVHRDSPLPSKTLLAALTKLVAQMKSNSDSLNRPTVSTTVTAGSANNGNTVVAVSTTDNLGAPLDNVIAETITVTCTTDSEAGATEYQETLTVAGQPIKAATAYDWPGGSGASGSFQVTNAAATTLLTDGDFELWGGTGNNTPTHWTAVTGSYGTHILRSSSAVRGSYACQLSSTGSTAAKVKQAVTVEPITVYAVNMWAKVDGLDGTGVFRVRLCDGSGNTISDEASTTNLYTRNVNGQIGTSYTQVQTFFRIPRQLPSEVFLEWGWSTAPGSTQLLNVDLLAMVKAVQLYPGGPYAAAFSKDDATTKEDTWSIAVTNSLNHTSFVRSLDRLMSLRNLGVALPSSGSPTVSDALIP